MEGVKEGLSVTDRLIEGVGERLADSVIDTVDDGLSVTDRLIDGVGERVTDRLIDGVGERLDDSVTDRLIEGVGESDGVGELDTEGVSVIEVEGGIRSS